ncbi:MAG: hypothetical protein OCD01_04715 [Fibrobacterales bacterium]
MYSMCLFIVLFFILLLGESFSSEVEREVFRSDYTTSFEDLVRPLDSMTYTMIYKDYYDTTHVLKFPRRLILNGLRCYSRYDATPECTVVVHTTNDNYPIKRSSILDATLRATIKQPHQYGTPFDRVYDRLLLDSFNKRQNAIDSISIVKNVENDIRIKLYESLLLTITAGLLTMGAELLYTQIVDEPYSWLRVGGVTGGFGLLYTSYALLSYDPHARSYQVTIKVTF